MLTDQVKRIGQALWKGLGPGFLLLALDLHGAEGGTWRSEAGYRVKPLTVAASGKTGFTRMNSAQTGLNFTNYLSREADMANANLINGSGVALGDIDGDGWCDLYFCNLSGTNRLYKNKGGWQFTDVTTASGVELVNQLSRGAVFADVEGDGDLDLIVSFNSRGARLFINDGRGHFTESTPSGLSTRRGGTSLALGDLDGDGFLDLYVANYGEETLLRGGGSYSVSYENGKPVVRGRWARRLKIVGNLMIEMGEIHDFYLNDGRGKFILQPWTEGRFLDEDGQALGTHLMDFGLSVQIRDLNRDGLPDIYVCNDFHTPDRIWLNQGQGRFRMISRLALRTIPYASMGIDVGDLDRDGEFDLFTAEMRPTSHDLLMRQLSGVKPEHTGIGQIENRILTPRNTLAWNRGDGTYAEVAWFAGLAASDWTWMPMCLDVDLDGYEDLLLINGYLHNVNDADLTKELTVNVPSRKVTELRQRLMTFPAYASPNYAYRNRGDLTFEEMGKAWGFEALEIAQSMAAADLDQDGDLDLVVNCLNTGALAYRNDSPAPRIAVRLKGTPGNTQGINSLIKVRGGPVPMQMQEVLGGGRYLGGDDPIRTFAAGSAAQLNLEVTWRSGRRSVISNASPNCLYEIDEAGAVNGPRETPPAIEPWFVDVSQRLNHTQVETAFDDFSNQPLLPNRLSQLGPGISWFDWDGNGFDDLVIGSGKGGRLAIFQNDGQGGFSLVPSFTNLLARDCTTVLGWTAQPGKTCLLAGSANYEDGATTGEKVIQIERQGGVRTAVTADLSSVGPLSLADVDQDGSLDLFVGGRVVPGRYPEPASSKLFLNRGGTLVPDARNNARFDKIGLVAGSVFTDLNGDGWPDLVLACEWGPIRVFLNEQGQFKEATQPLGFSEQTGWWTGIAAGDFDADGKMDLVAGNWGFNSRYRASPQHPVRLYYGDFNGAGEVDLVEAYDELTPGKIVPRRNLTDLSLGLPFLQEKYARHRDYARASVKDLLGDRMQKASELRATTLATTLFLNRGQRFEARPLPSPAQWAPVYGVNVGDLDGDGNEDVFLSQNFFDTQLGENRLDAGRSLWLQGNGQGDFKPVPGQQSGLLVYGEQRGSALGDFDADGRVDLAVTQNGAPTKLFWNRGAKPGLRIRLQGPPGNPTAIGAQLRMVGNGPARAVREIHAGGGYWSQDSAVQVMAMVPGAELEVRWPGGKVTRTPSPAEAREIVVGLDGMAKKVR